MWRFVKKFHKALTGVCVLSGGSLTYYYFIKDKKVFASVPLESVFEPGDCDPPRSYTKWDDNWDRRSPRSFLQPSELLDDKDTVRKKLKMYKPKVVRHVILIRHGQYNTKGRTDEEQVLTPLGRLQAHYTGKRLKELNYPFTTMVKSTMARAQETGSIISEYLPDVPVIECNFIHEGMPIDPEPPVHDNWKPDLFSMVQYYQDGARIEAAFRKYFHRADLTDEQDQYTLIVCHANVIRYFVCRALQFPPEGWLRLSLPHASITWISIRPSGRCSLKSLGDIGHMPPNAITI